MTRKEWVAFLISVALGTMIVVGFANNMKPSINEVPDEELIHELDKLEYIGKVYAERIVNYRNKNKPIDLEDLRLISGVGPQRLSEIKRHFKE